MSRDASYRWPTRALLWIVGVDQRLIRECPARELHVHLATATAVVTTSCLASCSGWLALVVVTGHASAWHVPLALLWGMIVMNVDRIIVLSSHASQHDLAEVAAFKRHFAPLLIRVPVALLLAFVIVIPVELLIFEREISASIAKANRERIGDDVRSRRKEVEAQIADARSRLSAATARLTSLEMELGQLENQLTKESRQRDITYHVRIDGAGEHFKEQTRTMTAAYEILKDRVVLMRTTVSRAEGAQKAAADDLRTREDARRSMLAVISAEEAKATTAVGGLATQVAALETIKASDRVWWRLGWAIRLMFMLIETIPVLGRALGGTPVYDALCDARARKAVTANGAEAWSANVV